MTYALLDQAIATDAGLNAMSTSQRKSLQAWLQAELDRISGPLTPAAWFLAEVAGLQHFLVSVLERGEDFVADALANPDGLVDLVAPRSVLLDRIDAQDGEMEPDEELRPPSVDWPEVLDIAAWTAACPSLASARDARHAILGDLVGHDLVEEFVARVRRGWAARETVRLGPEGALGAFQIKTRREFTFTHPETGEQSTIPAKSILAFRAGKPVLASMQAGAAELEGDGPDHRLMRGVVQLLQDRAWVAAPGAGWFRKTEMRAHRATNPATGEVIEIPGRRMLAFNASPGLYRVASAAPPEPVDGAGPEHPLLRRVLASKDGLSELDPQDRLAVIRWMQDEIDRVAPALTPAAWFVGETAGLAEFCAAVVERGPAFVEAALADLDQLHAMEAPESELLRQIDAFHRGSDTEDRIAGPTRSWPAELDVDAWRAACPRLAADRQARDARLGDSVGQDLVAGLVQRIRDGLPQDRDVPLGPGGTLGSLTLRKRPTRRYRLDDGSTQVFPAQWHARFQPHSSTKALFMATGDSLPSDPLPDDGPDAQLLTAVRDLLREHDRVALPGVGWFLVHRTQPRRGTSPSGEVSVVPMRTHMLFQADPAFAAELNAAAEQASGPPPGQPSRSRTPTAREPDPPPAKKPWWKIW